MTITIQVGVKDTLLKVKEKTQDEVGIACEYQSISLYGYGAPLSGDSLVSSFIRAPSFGSPIPTIYLTVKRPTRTANLVMDVKLDDDKEISFELGTNDSIKDLKRKIEQEMGIPVKEQTLLTPLSDYTWLAHCARKVFLVRTATSTTRNNDANTAPTTTAAVNNDQNNNYMGNYIVLLAISTVISPYVIAKEALHEFFGSLWP